MTPYSKSIAALVAAVVVFVAVLVATRDVDLALFAFASAAPVALGVLVAPANRSVDRARTRDPLVAGGELDRRSVRPRLSIRKRRP